jgi:hypothetical protein
MWGKIPIAEEVININQKHILLIGKLFPKNKAGTKILPGFIIT